MRIRITTLLTVVALLLLAAAPTIGASELEPRIVGGTEVDPPDAYPFVVAVLRTANLPDVWAAQFCGGSLIGPSTVLTAGHCVSLPDSDDPEELAVAVGRHDLRNDAQGEIIAVTAVDIHPDFVEETLEADMAVLTLERDAVEGDLVAPATEADAARYLPGTIGVAAGWGSTLGIPPGTPTFPDALRAVELPIVSDDVCIDAYGDLFHPGSMMCAGLDEGDADSCSGDSGGPLFVDDETGVLLVGVISWGNGCAKQGFPGVYARVAEFDTWIRSALDPDLPSCLGFAVTIEGTDGPDEIRGTPGRDVIAGGGGDDVIWGADGDDVLCGGPGDDLVLGGYGNDRIAGGDGADRLRSGPGIDVVDAGSGDDVVVGGRGADTILGGPGADRLFGGAGPDELFGGDGRDLLIGAGGADVADGGDGDDVFRGGPGRDVAFGGAGEDRLIGADDADRLVGGAERDVLFGNDGNDIINGGSGNDVIRGGLGDDLGIGGGGNDRLVGGGGADVLEGSPGDDRILAGGGDDIVYGQAGADELRGGDGNDLIIAGDGDDLVFGNAGDDELNGGEGFDVLRGGHGIDQCFEGERVFCP